MFNITHMSTTSIYTLSLHDALPIWITLRNVLKRPLVAETSPFRSHLFFPEHAFEHQPLVAEICLIRPHLLLDRKSTRLNSSHSQISYAVFCLKKKKHIITSVMYTID